MYDDKHMLKVVQHAFASALFWKEKKEKVRRQ
jgi:hypothetical protein